MSRVMSIAKLDGKRTGSTVACLTERFLAYGWGGPSRHNSRVGTAIGERATVMTIVGLMVCAEAQAKPLSDLADARHAYRDSRHAPAKALRHPTPFLAKHSRAVRSAAPVVARPKPTPPSASLFGDWNGLRRTLAANGVTYVLGYTTESAGDVAGGLRRGATYVHQVDLKVDVDWGALAGIDGFSTHTEIINRAGRNVTADYVGDNVIYAQEAYGAGVGRPERLALFYGQQSFLDGRVTLTFGRLVPATEFAQSNLYCSFVSLTICGTQRALNITQSFSVFPYTVWGSAAKLQLVDDLYVRFGTFQSQPLPTASQPYTQGGSIGWDWTFDGTTGVSLPLEVGYEPKLGLSQLQGRYKLGLDFDTSTFKDDFFDRNFHPLVLSGQPGRGHDGRTIFWATAEQMVLQSGEYQDDGLYLLAAYSHTQSDTSLFKDFVWVGLLDRGIFAARPRDQFAVGVTLYDVSNRLTRTEELQSTLGLPLTGGAHGVQTSGLVYESNYDFRFDKGLEVQPDLQFYARPGASKGIPDALVVALRTRCEF